MSGWKPVPPPPPPLLKLCVVDPSSSWPPPPDDPPTVPGSELLLAPQAMATGTTSEPTTVHLQKARMRPPTSKPVTSRATTLVRRGQLSFIVAWWCSQQPLRAIRATGYSTLRRACDASPRVSFYRDGRGRSSPARRSRGQHR